MEEASDPIVIPGWIWVMVVMFVVGVIVALIVKRDRDAGRKHRGGKRRGSRHHRTSSSGSSGSESSSRSSSRHRGRTADPFDKY